MLERDPSIIDGIFAFQICSTIVVIDSNSIEG